MSDRVFHPSGGPMLTKQSEKDSTDVNLIMDSWIHAGAAVAGHLNPGVGSYGDFSSGIDYHAALDAVKAADAAFMSLPPQVRSHVDNDSGKFLDLMFDPGRSDEREKLGLAKPKAVVVPEKVEKVPAQPVVDPPKGAVVDPAPAGGDGPKSADPAAGLFD